MARLTKAQKAEQAEAIAKLREILKPGDTVSCILRSTSRSGMSRTISCLGGADMQSLDHLIARACDYPMGANYQGLKVGGCGMDMGFSVVYNLSATLFPDGFGCTGKGEPGSGIYCPSNDHSNGDRDYTPHGPALRPGQLFPDHSHWHSSGGYALRHRWL